MRGPLLTFGSSACEKGLLGEIWKTEKQENRKPEDSAVFKEWYSDRPFLIS